MIRKQLCKIGKMPIIRNLSDWVNVLGMAMLVSLLCRIIRNNGPGVGDAHPAIVGAVEGRITQSGIYMIQASWSFSKADDVQAYLAPFTLTAVHHSDNVCMTERQTALGRALHA